MVAKFLKKRSKRVPARRRYKVEKRVRQHNKKLRREAKKNPKTKSKKDPGVPNSLPFKEEILQEAEERKRQAEELKLRQKEEMRNPEAANKRKLEELEEEALLKGSLFNAKKMKMDVDAADADDTVKETTGKGYYKEFKKVIDAADVILEILDARDPLGSRCPQVEEAVINSGPNKKLVLILNKIDLVPTENVTNWLKYLRNELPTIAFKSSTQNQKSNLARSSVPIINSTKLAKSSYCLGANVLMKLLGNYCRNKDIRTHIRVGIVGFPNVGKSSVINSLKRTRVCNVGATPGITKAMQEIHLDKHVVLLDSPGIVFAKSDSVASALRNAVKVESLKDPIAPVEEILKRCNRKELLMFYSIPEFNTVAEFLALVAKKQGKLKKRGVPNINEAAKTIINNWNEGKIKYYTHPPNNALLPSYLDAKIVSEMSAAFDIDKLLEDEQEVMSSLPKVRAMNFITNESSGPIEAVIEIDQPEEEVPELMDEDKKVKDKCEKVPQRMQGKAKKLDNALTLDGNLKLNQLSKSQFKRLKKKRKRNEKVAEKLSDSLTSAMKSLGGDGDDTYNFKDHSDLAEHAARCRRAAKPERENMAALNQSCRSFRHLFQRNKAFQFITRFKSHLPEVHDGGSMVIEDVTKIPLNLPLKSIPPPIYRKLHDNDSNSETKVTTLPNGLRVASENRFGQFCTVGVIIDSGSRYEVGYPSGISHYLEKLAFNSTSEYQNREAIMKDLEKYGGICDCQTSRDCTIYATSVSTEGVPTVVRLLSEVILRPKLISQELVEVGSMIQFEVEDMNIKPEQEPILTEMIHAGAYNNNTVGLPKFCPVENISKINNNLLYTYLKSYYQPKNMVLAGVGIDHDKLVELAKKYFMDKPAIWQENPELCFPGAEIKDTSIAQYTGGLIRKEKDLSNVSLGPTPIPELAHIVLGFESSSHQDKDFISFCVLNMMMGGGGSFSAGGPGKGMYTRLYTNVLNRFHWMYNATAYNHAYNDTGIFCIHASAHPSQLNELVEVIVKEFVGMAGEITDKEIDRAKTQLQSMLLMNLESRPVVFEDIARQVLATEHRKMPQHFIDEINKINPDDIRRVANRMLRTKPTLAALGNLEKLPAIKDVVSALANTDGRFSRKFSIFR
uniref:Guanine nucleotide-binding protein-like 3 homolog n=1 Tax=Strigamia maritima TaxID=126957 RepID=T1ILS6_STRMM